jgi:hypothetical protein
MGTRADLTAVPDDQVGLPAPARVHADNILQFGLSDLPAVSSMDGRAAVRSITDEPIQSCMEETAGLRHSGQDSGRSRTCPALQARIRFNRSTVFSMS